MKKLLLIIAIIFLAGAAYAEPILTCKPMDKMAETNNAIIGFQVQIDNGEWIDAGMRDNNDGTVQLWHDLSGIEDGKHVVKTRAYNVFGGGAPSDPFVFLKKLPSKPEKLRFYTK